MKPLIFAVALLLSFPLLAANRHNDGDYVIVLNGNESPDVVKRQHGIGKRPNKDKQWDKTDGFHGFSAHLNGKQADDLEADTRVAVIEPDITASVLTPGVAWAKALGGTGSDIARVVATDASGNAYVCGGFQGIINLGDAPLVSAGGIDLFLAKYSAAGSLAWSKRIGGAGAETVRGIALDGSGNIVLTGSFQGASDFGGGAVSSAGNSDIFIAKYDSTGGYLWSRVIGGLGDDVAEGLALDSSGNVVVTGYFQQTVNFGNGNLFSAFQGKDTFLAKYSSANGAWIFAENFPSNADDEGTGVAVDSGGNIYLCGNFSGNLNFGLGNLAFAGGSDVYLAKFNSTGTVTWNHSYGGPSGDKSVGVGVDASGNVYLLGYFIQSINLGGGTITTASSDDDVFLAKYTTAGNYSWAKSFPGPGFEVPGGLAVDTFGNVSITGYFQYTINLQGTTLTSTTQGVEDVFYAQYSPSGGFLAGMKLGGTGSDQGIGVALDQNGNALVAGFFSGTATFGSGSLTSAGGTDGFLASIFTGAGNVALPWIPLTPTGWKLSDGYSARCAKQLDPVSGLIPVLVSPITNVAGMDKIYCCFINYAAHTSSMVELTNLTLTATPPGGGIVMSGTNLWVNIDTAPCFAPVYNTSNVWQTLHYGLIGSPPTSVALLDATPIPDIGCGSIDQSQVALFYTQAGGVFGQFALPNPFTGGIAPFTNRTAGLIYKTPLGAWTSQYPISPVVTNGYNVEDWRTSFAQHPADGSVWGITCEPGSYVIRATRLVEAGGTYSYVFTPNYIPQGSVYENAYESPPICTIRDTYRNVLSLFYGSYRFNLGVNMQYSPITVTDIAANGTYTVYQNTNYYVGPLMTGVAGIPIDADNRLLIYRDEGGPIDIGFFAQSEGFTHVTLSKVLLSGSTFGPRSLFLDDASIFISYVGNAAGTLAASYPDNQVRFYWPQGTTSQTIPTGVRRIGTEHNPYAQLGWLNRTNVNVDVAVIDTGIQLNHPDLNVYTNVTFVSGTTTGNDDNGHGTHVAGIIGALDNNIGVVGVAPGSRLWAVKVMDSNGSAPLSAIISGVDWVSQNSNRISVANMSLGGQGLSASLRLAIQNSVSKGIVYVVSAGNSNFDVYGGDRILGTSDDFFPACYPEVMCVSGMADTDSLLGGAGPSVTVSGWPTMADDTMATFSNYSLQVVDNPFVLSPGKAIDVAAPSVNILSTYTNSAYATISGTSMAAPHASGAVALYIAEHGRATDATGVYAIRQAIVNNAVPPSLWGINDWNPHPLFDFYPEGLLSVSESNPSKFLNNFPVIHITSPVAGQGFYTGVPVTLTGDAFDQEDGDLSSIIHWRWVAVGAVPFATGAVASVTFTNDGSHALAAEVTDSNGWKSTDFVTVYSVASPAPLPPTITITNPANGGTIYCTNYPAFTCSVIDPVDGDITSSAAWWFWNVNGCENGCVMAYGSPALISLQQGWWSMAVVATNSFGLSATNNTRFFVDCGITNTPPVINFMTPATGATYTNGSTIVFIASVIDPEDGNIADHAKWSSSIDGPLAGSGCNPANCMYSGLTNSTLSIGRHTITVTAADNGTGPGTTILTNSASIIVNITTNNVTLPRLTTTLTSDFPTYHWKQKAKLTAHVTSGTNVPNASVQFVVKGMKGNTPLVDYLSATTDSSGNAIVYYRVPPTRPDPQTFTVNATASKSGYQSGAGTVSFTSIQK